MIHGKTLSQWCRSHPHIAELANLQETQWFNPAIAPAAQASARLQRFAPYLAQGRA